MYTHTHTSSLFSFTAVSLKRSKDDICILLLTLRTVQMLILDVLQHRLGQQVAHALAPAHGSSHMCGREIIGHPFPHDVDVLTVFVEHIRLVDKLLCITTIPGDAHKPKAAHDLCDILILPHIGDAEGLQYVCSTQQLELKSF